MCISRIFYLGIKFANLYRHLYGHLYRHLYSRKDILMLNIIEDNRNDKKYINYYCKKSRRTILYINGMRMTPDIRFKN